MNSNSKKRFSDKLIEKLLIGENIDINNYFNKSSVTYLLKDINFVSLFEAKINDCFLNQSINCKNFYKWLIQNKLVYFDDFGCIKSEYDLSNSKLGIFTEILLRYYLTYNNYQDDKKILANYIINICKNSVAANIAWQNNPMQLLTDLKLFLDDYNLLTRIYSKAKWLFKINSKLVTNLDDYSSYNKCFKNRLENKLINDFEIDFLFENKTLIDIKNHNIEFDYTWLMQLLLYFLIIKQSNNDLVKYIGIYNPNKSILWSIQLYKIIDIDKLESWAKKIKII